MRELATFIKPGRYDSLTRAEVLEIRDAELERREWDATKRRVVDEFTRERTGDPSMTAKVWRVKKNMMKTREKDWA
jgi:hypothetical protein